MSILEFRSSLDETQQEELTNIRELMDNFLNQFQDAFAANSQEPSDQWELVRMSLMRDIMKDVHIITIYDYQAIEYLVLLFFTYTRTNHSISYRDGLLEIAESNFINYCMKTSSDTPGLDHKERDIALQSYYDLHDAAKEDCDAKFYFAVYTLCPLIMEHCRKMYIKFTTPRLKKVK